MRRAYNWDDQAQVLQPVHGLAISKVDLRTRDAWAVSTNLCRELHRSRRPEQTGSQSLSAIARPRPAATCRKAIRNAAPIPIFARTGIYQTSICRCRYRSVDTLIVPATPASRFHSYQYQNLATANDRHWRKRASWAMRCCDALESERLERGLLPVRLRPQCDLDDHAQVQEDWLPTTVDVVLDDACTHRLAGVRDPEGHEVVAGRAAGLPRRNRDKRATCAIG